MGRVALIFCGAAFGEDSDRPQHPGSEQIPGKIAPFFHPPPEYADDFGDYRSPLKFYDGRPVKTAADWQARRREILDRWHKIMGPWPPLVEKPKIEYLEKQRRENFTQHRVRVEIAPGIMHPAILLVPTAKAPFPRPLSLFIGLNREPDCARGCPTSATN